MHDIVENVKANDSRSTLGETKKGNKIIDTKLSHKQSAVLDGHGDVRMENYADTAGGKDKNLENGQSTSDKGENSTEKNGKSSDGGNKGTSNTDKTKSGAGASDQQKNKNETNGENKSSGASTPPPPVMKGTLSCDIDQRRHLIRGMWNYENSKVFPPQPFELLRDLDPSEDKDVLPQNGVFHGSFRLAYVHTTSKGKQKERLKSIQETGVDIKFTKVEGEDGEYKVDGKGTNQFGIFHINGTASRSNIEGDNSYNVVLRKRYESSDQPSASNNNSAVTPAPAPVSGGKRPHASASNDADSGPLPPPSKSYPSGVVCLRGKVYQEVSTELGMDDVVQRIDGMWSSGLDLILADPQNVRGLCNRFEYEHKSSKGAGSFPVSGRYSGWFDLSVEDGNKSRINERDVTLKFRKNRDGYHNVEGKGSNVFGKYSITGTLTLDKVITIFRHFQPRKLKTSKAAAAPPQPSAVPSTSAPRRPSATTAMTDAKLKLDDVKLPDVEKPAPIAPPENGSYSAVSRGVLRVNNDGSHSCQGKWAEMRDHFNNGQTSSFNFRLEPHFAADALAEQKTKTDGRTFPVDSAMYRGSFQLKKGSRSSTVVDQQIVMRFHMNNQGSFNVHGKGVNAIGDFNLVGTLIMSGKTGGQVELYRMYPPKANKDTSGADAASQGDQSKAAASKPAIPPPATVQRRESTRLVKLPSRLEDDDPSAQMSRVMDKCSQILRIIREKDVELGAFFSEPVDPVALGIPTYYSVIKEPMDLRTVYRKMESNQIETPEEFSRLVRLVFENAITFNIDPAHSVHQAARSLLVQFNQKFRDIERMVQNMRRALGADWDGKKKKDDKKRKRGAEEPISLKRRRLEEAQAMSAANASAVAALVAAAPTSAGSATTVTRPEFNMLLSIIQQLQQQIVQTHTALAELCPGDENDAKSVTAMTAVATAPPSVPSSTAPAPAPEPKKKAPRRKSESAPPPPEPVYDDAPLTLEEQELLTETINDLPAEHLGGVIQILREAAPVGADEDEIDLDIDQLDTKTQRKLLAHVSKFVKKSKAKGRKKPPAKAPAPKKQKVAEPAPAPAKPKPPVAKPDSEPFFEFNKDNSESEDENDEAEKPPVKEKEEPPPVKEEKDDDDDAFKLNDDQDEDENDDDDDEDMETNLAANWAMKTTTESSANSKASDDDDDAWGAAREEAAAAKAKEAERKAREEKLKKEAEEIKNQRLADAAAQAKAQREEEEAKNAKLREKQEKEAEDARKAARDAVRATVNAIEPTVDLGDSQRDLMKQYEESFMDKDYGSASPSSDFGF